MFVPVCLGHSALPNPMSTQNHASSIKDLGELYAFCVLNTSFNKFSKD